MGPLNCQRAAIGRLGVRRGEGPGLSGTGDRVGTLPPGLVRFPSSCGGPPGPIRPLSSFLRRPHSTFRCLTFLHFSLTSADFTSPLSFETCCAPSSFSSPPILTCWPFLQQTPRRLRRTQHCTSHCTSHIAYRRIDRHHQPTNRTSNCSFSTGSTLIFATSRTGLLEVCATHHPTTKNRNRSKHL